MESIFGLFTSLSNVAIGRAQVKANNMLSQVNAEAGNKVRQARNAAGAAKNSLARWTQSVNNNRVLDQGGNAMEASTVNSLRGMDAGTFQDFSSIIRQAEQYGAAAASQAAAGVGGSVVDMVNGATALRNSMVNQRTADIKEMQGHDAAKQAGQILRHTIGSLDSSIILDSFDTNIDVAQKQVGPSYGRALFSWTVENGEAIAKMAMGMPPTGGDKQESTEEFGARMRAPDTKKFNFNLNTGASFDLGTTESFRSY